LRPAPNALEHLRAEWPTLVEKCRKAQPLLQHVLRDSWPVSLNATTLHIGFDPEFASEIETVRQSDRGALRHLFQMEIGHPVHVEYEILREPLRWSHQAPREEVAPPREEKAFSPASAGVNRQAWLRNESVRQVLETFHGDILDIQR
jgi:hypothetical protein